MRTMARKLQMTDLAKGLALLEEFHRRGNLLSKTDIVKRRNGFNLGKGGIDNSRKSSFFFLSR